MTTRIRDIGRWLGPAGFLLVCVLPPPEALSVPGWRTAGVAWWMAVWWVSEAVPMAVTALLPIVLFPLSGVLKASQLGSAYGHYFIFMFMGGFMLARAIERWNLHERMALHVVRRVGVSPRRLILGLMVATGFMSMWISNTASTLIMMPIGMAILAEAAVISGRKVSDDPQLASLATCMMLGIAYAANIGGMGTLVGTAPNVVFASQLTQLFPDAPEVTFMGWMRAALPLVVVMIPLTWVYLTRWAVPVRMVELPGGAEVIARRLAALPPATSGERRVAWVFLLTALAWITRKPIDLGVVVIPGWSSVFGVAAWVNDATVAIAAAVALFVIPSGEPDPKRGDRLLDWDTAVSIPWGLLVLFGGGLALAKGVKETGLAVWIGGLLEGLQAVPIVLLVLVLCLVMVFLTEITSNTAVSTLFMPILAALAIHLGQSPVLFMLPAVWCASCAFMLPVATPPNAIVFSSGYLRIPEMARAGFLLNLIAVAVVVGGLFLVGVPAFDITVGERPSWALDVP